MKETLYPFFPNIPGTSTRFRVNIPIVESKGIKKIRGYFRFWPNLKGNLVKLGLHNELYQKVRVDVSKDTINVVFSIYRHPAVFFVKRLKPG